MDEHCRLYKMQFYITTALLVYEKVDICKVIVVLLIIPQLLTVNLKQSVPRNSNSIQLLNII